jgi:hypothetical protein
MVGLFNLLLHSDISSTDVIFRRIMNGTHDDYEQRLR